VVPRGEGKCGEHSSLLTPTAHPSACTAHRIRLDTARPNCPTQALGYTLAAFDTDRDGALSARELAAVLRSAYGRFTAGGGADLTAPADWEGYAARLAEAVAGGEVVGGGGAGSGVGVSGVGLPSTGGSGAPPPVRLAGFKILMATESALRVWLPVVTGGALGEEEAGAADRVREVVRAERELQAGEEGDE
jgi:hypothetical protein